MTRKNGQILGVNIDITLRQRVLRQVQNLVQKNKKFYIVTPNPEIIIKAQEDKTLMDILNEADISIPDGVGVVAAHRFILLPNPEKPLERFVTLIAQGLGVGFSILFDREWLEEDMKSIKGRDLFLDLIKVANKRKWRVYFLGGKSNEARSAVDELRKNYKGVVLRSSSGPMLDEDGGPITKRDRVKEKQVVKEIDNFKPHLLFVGILFPRQEKWIKKWLPNLNVNGAMVVGGTFNYISGKAKLPPFWMQEVGLEWFWRFVNEPKRIFRMYNALIRFPLEVFSYKFNKDIK